MERFLEAIEKSIETENWYAAIGLSLAVPDICGWLEDPSKGSKIRFMEWFDKYMLSNYKNDFFGPDFAFLAAGDCYALRCSYLHEGADEISRQKARDVLTRFTFSTTGCHLIKVDDILLLNVTAFCNEVCKAVRSWMESVREDEEIKNRMMEIVSVKTTGFQMAPGIHIG